MPTVTINIAGRGTGLNDAGNGQPGTSSVGHMWYQLNDGAGNSASYGFAPDAQHHGDPFAPGRVYRNDSSNYQSTEISRTIEITQAQYDAMKNFGEDPFGSGGFSQRYNGLTNSCIDFTWKALEKGGLNPSGFQGDIWPTDNIDDVNNIGNPTTPPGSTGGGDPFTGLPWPGGDPGGRTGGGAGGSGGGGGAAGGTGGAGGGAGAGGTTPPRRDPLVLDLDGDGIETTSTRDGTVILFDHDADGVKTGTGWVKPDDGWLVLDRNGNGTIDSGRELFGVDTLKSNGQLATDGFDALKDLDANQDGKIDATDSVFASLRIWRDLNQDGISQANELTTLAANSITGIGVNSSAVRTDLGNGNVQTAAGSFTRSNGTTGTTGETNGAAANLDLLVNTFYRTFTTQITLTDQAKALPTLRGSGRVRDLNEAVSLSTDLGNWVQTYTQQTTRQGQSDKLDGFIEKWANTADLKSLKAQADALTGSGVNLTYSLAGLTAGTPAYDDFVRKLGVIERFMGFTYGGANGQARFTPLDAGSGNLTVSLAAEQIASISLAYDRFKTDIYESLVSETRLKSYSKLLLEDSQSASEFASLENAFKQAITLNSQQGIIDLVEFISSVGEARLAKSGWGSMGFLVAQLNAAPDLGAFSEELSSWTVRLAASTEHNLTGTSRPDLIVGSAGDDNIQGFDGNDILLGKGGNDAIDGGNGDDVILGGAGNDSLSGGAGVDRLEGGDGNDLIQGGVGDDLIDGGAGNDILAGGVYDTWNGNYNGAGNDTYRFGRGSGQDIIRDIDSVVSNRDVIELGTGISQADVKLTRSASGDLVLTVANSTDTLTINSYFDSLDAGAGAIEVLKFADGSTWDVARMKTEVQKATSGNDYLVGYGATNDTFLAGAGDDQIYGRDGNDNLDGQDGNDAVYGEAGDDTVSGGNGNDSLYGGDGNDIINGGNGDDGLVGENGADTLNGDAGNDVLQGGAGNDTLNGGAGNDILAGGVYDTWNGNYNGAGNDTYQFGRGDGQDTIIDDDATVGNLDKLVFKTGVAVADVQAVRDGDALILKINGTTDQVRIDSYFSNDGVNNRQIEEIRFTDSATTVWKLADIKAKVLTGTVGNDTIIGYASADTISGADGNDSLYGRDGNDIINGGNGDDGLVGENGDDKLNGDAGADVLQGGAGNDTLNGGAGNDILAGGVYDTWNGNYNGAGNDTYQFGRGDGQDRIVDVDATVGNLDKLVFKTGVAVTDVQAVREGDALILKINGTTDQVRIDSYFSNDGVNSSMIEEIRFTDAATTVWKLADIKAKVLTGTAGNDTIIGYASADTISGADGNDSLYGRDGNDTINGGNGDDGLVGENGDDKLNGDAGADVLQGGAGNDTLNGGAGNDILAGGVYDTWNGNYNGAGNDTYQFGRGDGQDRIVDVDATAGNVDVLSVGAGVAANQLWFRQVGSDLEVSIIGGTDKSTISNWYSGSTYHVEQFKTSDGKMLLDSQVDALVSAMAAFAPPAAGQTTLPSDYQTALNPVIAANWK